ncbi:unnamed protein product [Phytophthora fragariaefolia]|uniref:Unnamed protein product n=1 Tax=Phytophthora fragariaefolia TaxID=1490495 RepID=A0A9W7CXF9_9STRA|nr:unnamed protein product [Phytophthora fragariaefolia]
MQADYDHCSHQDFRLKLRTTDVFSESSQIALPADLPYFSPVAVVKSANVAPKTSCGCDSNPRNRGKRAET